MAGLIPLNGYLSKEMMLEEAAHTAWLQSTWLVPALATFGALLSAAYSFRYVAHVFLGPERDDYPSHPHDPGAGMWLAPAFLVSLVVLIGLFPETVAGGIVAAAAGAVTGGDLPEYHLKLWHGLTPAFYMSAVALSGGLMLLWGHAHLNRAWTNSPRPEAKTIFDAIVGTATRISRILTDRLHDGALTRYAAIFVAFTLGLAGYAWLSGTLGPQTRAPLEIAALPLIGWIGVIVSTVLMVAFHRRRLLALILMGVVGLVVSVSFNYLSAPDLALTQISVEVVTIVLMLLALNFMPKETPRESSPVRKTRDAVLSIGAGLGVGGLIYALMRRDFDLPTISEYHLNNSYSGGGGTNVVNVILVDFRGFDTFGEITVLGIAAIVIFAVTQAVLSGPVRGRLLNRKPDAPQSGDAHPLMMVVVTRMMMPVALMVAAFIFFRGHNLPGGGFIAGLIAAIAVVMQYMASGFGWAAERQHVPYHGIIGSGVLVAAVTGMGAWLAGEPFLTSAFGYVHLPGLEKFELATAALFDLGVFLAVVGAVMLALESFSRFAWQPGIAPEHAMDINPARDLDPKNPEEV